MIAILAMTLVIIVAMQIIIIVAIPLMVINAMPPSWIAISIRCCNFTRVLLWRSPGHVISNPSLEEYLDAGMKAQSRGLEL